MDAVESVEPVAAKKTGLKLKITAGIAAVLAITLGGSSVAYGMYFEDRALPSVTIAGQDVSGMKEAEIAKMITDQAGKQKLKFKVGEKEVTATYAEIGVETDAEATAKNVLKANQSIWNRFTAYFNPTKQQVVTKFNETKFNDFLGTLEKTLDKPRQDAALNVNAETGEFSVVPGKMGEVVDKEDLRTQVEAQVMNLTSEPIITKIVSLEPELTDAEVTAFQQKATELANLDLTFFEGEEDITIEYLQKVGLISFKDAAGKTVEPKYDADKVREFVAKLAEQTNEEPEPALHNVNGAGKVLAVAKEGKPGWKVNNASAVADAAVNSLAAGKAFRGEFTYDKIQQKVETRLIADGAENLAYQAAPGERWIDINLSNYTMTAYEGATPVFFTDQIVPGANETPTVVGKFAVYLKYNVQDMRGTNFDGTPYLTKGVPWVTYFHGGYAIHGAPWRSVFGLGHGGNGTHGCINTPTGNAKWIYDWSQMGDPVVVHY
ncbi:ErfK/YbiS/YcfS/YnhG [Gleimia coleocanis DSM 15436]|uniref:ErfK/YbiS/YcfS/YnhG n=1 Tax=Gleimia coleocanis DSM 15436 TaxID=525245 RepID=C0W0R7_9ACTO|nr:L,D-transpeptidase family protein [Gleimia coleocanis]EEH63641.1 ErfK/YbiS/YcfS/YnhG [Gleimia coleocanis DSM 15436]